MDLLVSVFEGLLVGLIFARHQRLGADKTIPLLSICVDCARIGGFIGALLGIPVYRVIGCYPAWFDHKFNSHRTDIPKL